MELINNTSKTLKDDLSVEIKKGSKLSIAAACFSIYAFQELKKQLTSIEELRFIFTSPTFVAEKTKKEKREFYIPRLNRERSLYGTEFEIKLRNEMTQKAIAKECADWIKEKVTFKSNISDKTIQGQLVVDDTGYTPINNFTTVELGCEKGNVISTTIVKDQSLAQTLIRDFNEIWNDKKVLQEVTDEVVESITAAYNENSPDFIYFVTLYNIFNEFLEDVSEDVLPNEATGFKDSKIWGMLYNFQKDAALAIINKLEKYNGCILADSVGLGKTFTALSVIKYYENRNKSVLVLCPKKLANNWNTYKDNYINNPIASDRLRYDVLYHTDLNRTRGTSNGIDLSRINWGNYDLVVIDESHNFRNGGKLVENPDEDSKDNRYVTLMKKVIRAGVKTKVLMLSATPVNNKFLDLKNQLALAYEGHTDFIDDKLNTNRSIDDIFKNAQRAFNTWSKWEPCDRTTENLLKMLDFDFFEVLDSVTIARSRKHIQKYYDTSDVGTFPTRLPPISLRPHLTDLKEAINYNEIFEQLMLLTLTIYTPTHYILPSKMEKYAELYGDNKVNVGFTQANREQGIRRLTAINLMKRMESSVYSFNLTLKRIKELIESTIDTIDRFDKHSSVNLDLTDISNVDEFDDEDQNTDDLFSLGKKVKIDLADMDYVSWRESLAKDAEVLELLTLMVGDITPEHDSKLQELYRVIDDKITHPINEGNKKIIIFTAFADTAGYLYDNVSKYVKSKYGLNSAMVSGSVDGRTTCPKLRGDLNTVLTCFSPISKDSVEIEQGNTLDEQIEVNEKRQKLEKEIAKLEKQARAEKQPKKKFELAGRVKSLKRELDMLHSPSKAMTTPPIGNETAETEAQSVKTVKAISILPEYAADIFDGLKTIEWRSWKTDYRGDLLICASSRKLKGCISGYALCMVELFDVVPFTRKHLNGALMESVPDPAGYAWLLKNVRLIKPFPYKGKLHLYDVDASLVEVLSPIHTKEADKEFEQYYKQLYIEAGAEF